MAAVEIRTTGEDDAPFMFEMLRGLAEHIGDLEHFTSTIEDVRRDGFGPQRHYDSLIAKLDGAPVGLATYFFTYSTHTGRPCLFVLDLIVRPDARGTRLGKALMGRLSAIAVERGCCRIDLNVHNANDASGFYQALGMADTGHTPYSLHGDALHRLAIGETA